MKELLIFTNEFPPDTSGRANKMKKRAELMPRFGWKPTYLLYTEYPLEKEKKEIGEEQIDIYRNHRGDLEKRILYWMEKGLGGVTDGFRFLDLYTPHLLRGLLKAREILEKERPDAICTMSYPFSMHLIGLYLKRKYGVRWLVELRDPWVLNPTKFNGDAGPLHRWLERKVLEAADAVVFRNGIQMDLDYFEENYSDKINEKVNKLPFIGYHEDDFDVEPEKFDEYTITYAGRFYGDGHDPINFLEALKQFMEQGHISEEEIRVNFLGDWKNSWERYISGTLLEDVVHSYGWVSYEKTVKVLKGSDLCIYFNRPFAGDELSISQKMGDYIGAGKPIISLGKEDWKSTRWMKEKSLGVWADHEDVEDIKRAIEEAYYTPEEELFSPPKEFLDEIKRENNVRLFCLVLDEITSR